MSVVIDNSMALAWALPDEGSDAADAVLDRVVIEGGQVPFLFPAELGNGLTVAMRRGRLGTQRQAEALAFIERLQLANDVLGAEPLARAIELADAYELTVYDALCIELSQRTRLPLATLDMKLAGAARQAGVLLTADRSRGESL